MVSFSEINYNKRLILKFLTIFEGNFQIFSSCEKVTVKSFSFNLNALAVETFNSKTVRVSLLQTTP